MEYRRYRSERSVVKREEARCAFERMKVGRSRMKISRSVDTNEREEGEKSGSLLKSVVEINAEKECDSRGAKEEGFRSKVDAVRGYRIKRGAEGEEEKGKCQGELRREKAARRSGWSLWVEPRVRGVPAKTGLPTPPPRSR